MLTKLLTCVLFNINYQLSQEYCIFASFHIRRTDKASESPDSGHNIKAYFEELKDFQTENMISGSELNQLVFIASDDHTVLEEARRE
jgi:hypothetical protein